MTAPADFPRLSPISSISGGQPKLAAVLDASGKYVAGGQVQDREARYEVCEDLVKQLVAKCQTNRSSKYAHLTEIQILERLLGQLLSTDWGTTAEMCWVFRQTSVELGWHIPEGAAALRLMLGKYV
jgi:hypothetical protein